MKKRGLSINLKFSAQFGYPKRGKREDLAKIINKSYIS